MVASKYFHCYFFISLVTNTVYLNEPHEIATLKSKWSDINNFL